MQLFSFDAFNEFVIWMTYLVAIDRAMYLATVVDSIIWV